MIKSDNKVMKALALTLIATSGAIQANAAFVDYTITDGGLENFTGSFDGTPINGGNAFLAGAIDIIKTSGGPGLPASYNTVCTDLGGTLFLNQTYGYTAPTLFAGQVGIAPPSWGATPAFAADAIQNAAALFYQFGAGPSGVLNAGTTSQKAGLQLAVWEALYDTGNALVVGPTGTRFQITSGDAAAIADANVFLSTLNTGSYNFPGYLLIPDPQIPAGQSDPAQELLIGVGDFTPAGVVPEPGVYAVATSAVAFFGLLAFGRRQKSN